MLSKDDLLFAVKRMDNLVEMDDLVVESYKEIHMILLNLKIESAHLTDRGKRNGISPICDALNKIAIGLRKQADLYKKDREKATEVKNKILGTVKDME